MNIFKTYLGVLVQAGLLLIAIPAFSQTPTSTLNYIETRMPRTQIKIQPDLDAKSPVNDSVMTTIQYIDGLGRPIQTVMYQASPADKDIVQPMAYDQFGREAIKYLPYAVSTASTGSFKTDALTTGAGVYKFYNPNGGIPTTPAQQTNGIVVTADPFAVTGYEPSPLNRVLEQGAPGESFQLPPGTGDPNSGNHTAKMDYSSNDLVIFNSANLANNPGNHKIPLYTATINPDQSRTLGRVNNNTYYGAGQLFITITKNENWNPNNNDGCIGTTEEYKDKEGHMVLRRTYDIAAGAVEILSTYYVYDDLGNLCFVLPPGAKPDLSQAISQTALDNLAYQYRYDERNRLTQKKLPGKGWEFMVYNPLDQVVATQTANQRNLTPQQWTLTKYDAQGRVIITGVWNYNTGSTADASLDAPVQTDFLALTNIYTTLTDTQGSFLPWENTNSNNTATGYDEQCYPRGHTYTFLTVNYYDTYDGIPGLPANYNKASTHSQMTTGLLTATKTYVLNTTDALWAVTYYDNDGMPVRLFKQHYLGGSSSYNRFNYNSDTLTYNFNKQPIFIQHAHYASNGTAATLALTSTDTYTYDQMGRKINTYSQLKDHGNAAQAKILVSQNIYNEIGQLKVKRLHAKSPYTSFLQAEDYRYTPRGWLSSINNANLDMTDAATNTTTGKPDQFGEELYYDAGAIPEYNGNIASVKWKSGTPAGQPAQSQQTYDYRYDPLNRLLNAVSSTSGTKGYYNENVAYNTMGNITSLGRYDQVTAGNAVQIDSLTYSYSGNRTIKVDNTATPLTCDACFIDRLISGTEYTYDIDGNLLWDKNKGITTAYNLLNLPQTLTLGGGNTVAYIYDANGAKLRKVSTVGSIVTTTEYIDGIEYDTQPGTTTPTLSFVQTEEGKARLSGIVYTYEYDLKDHLGDTRVTFNADASNNPQVLQLANYYPFGANIGTLAFVSGVKNHYLYNHKELQDETNLYDYGARFYDPVIGRWTTVDPLVEANHEMWTPYAYVYDDAIRFSDPDGRDSTDHSTSAAIEKWTNITAGATIVVGLGPEDPVADAGAVAEEAVGQIGAGGAWTWEEIMPWLKKIPKLLEKAADVVRGAGVISEINSSKEDKKAAAQRQRQLDVQHNSSKSKSSSDKHTKTRSGGQNGRGRNNGRGNKNKKYTPKVNPNKYGN